MKAAGKTFRAFALGSVLFASTAMASSAPDKPAGGISILPTPWIIAHRGGPLLWPEETMVAYEASTAAGNHFVDADCWMLNRDNGIAVMHDSSLQRTTDNKKYVGQLYARDWRQLRINGQKLLGDSWGSYEAPFLDELLVSFGNKVIISVESKDNHSGAPIVAKLKEYKISKDYALVSSYDASQLRAAISAGYKTCINLNDLTQPAEGLRKTGYWAAFFPYAGSEETRHYINSLHAAGIKALTEVNRQSERDKMISLGFDGFYTDDPLYLDMSGAYRRNTDPYSTQKWAAGMLEGQAGGRGHFTPPNKWGVDASFENTFKSCLQGWMCPIGGRQIAPEWSMELSITFGPRLQDDRWANVAVLAADVPLNNDAGARIRTGGYNILFYNTGGLSIYRYEQEGKALVTLLKTVKGTMIQEGEMIRYRITTTPEQIKVERLDGKASIEVKDAAYRGAYVTFGAKGQKADFSEVQLTVP